MSDGIRLAAVKPVGEGDESKTDTVVLFAIGDREYTIPTRPRVNIALRYLRNIRKMGPDVAQGALLEDMLGSEALDALCDYDDLTPEQLQAISEAAAKHALGALEDTEGNA